MLLLSKIIKHPLRPYFWHNCAGMVHTYGGQKNNTINLIVRQYAYFMVIFWYFFTHDELDRNMQPQHNITTMVVELFAPPAVWIQ
jgi:hypothetical protein